MSPKFFLHPFVWSASIISISVFNYLAIRNALPRPAAAYIATHESIRTGFYVRLFSHIVAKLYNDVRIERKKRLFYFMPNMYIII